MRKLLKIGLLGFVIIIFKVDFGFSQESQENNTLTKWIGIWNNDLTFMGASRIDSTLFGTKKYYLYDEKVGALQTIIKKEGLWYILLCDDSFTVVQADSMMKQIKSSNIKEKWYDGNTLNVYLKDYSIPPTPEILPDGHWLYFSTERDNKGITQEKCVKNHQLDSFAIFYNLKTKLPAEYFELKNGLLNGIVFFELPNNKGIKGISKYKDGQLIEQLYLRND